MITSRRPLHLAQDQGDHLSTRLRPRPGGRVPPPAFWTDVHLEAAAHREVLAPFEWHGRGCARGPRGRCRKEDTGPRRPHARRGAEQAHGRSLATRREVHAAHVEIQKSLCVQRRERAAAASSCPSDAVVGGLFSDYEAVRTPSSDRDARIGSNFDQRPPTSSSDGADARRRRQDRSRPSTTHR